MTAVSLFAKDENLPQGEIDSKGNVAFTTIVDELPLNQSDVYTAACKYIESEYKTARYSDIQKFDDKYIVFGKANLNSFYTENGLTNSRIFNVNFYLRIDSKEKKARIQLIFKDYDILKLLDSSNRESESVAIGSVAPFKKGKDDKRYTKAYNKLREFTAKILDSATTSLKNATSSPVADEW